jgi:hypothetical protein
MGKEIQSNPNDVIYDNVPEHNVPVPVILQLKVNRSVGAPLWGLMGR